MLIEFNFKNYKSFKDDTVLSFVASKEKEFEYHVRCESSEKILPVAVIYGANASGKTNVISALSYMQKMVIDSFKFGNEDKEEKYYRPTPFLFDNESSENDSTFEVYFSNEDKIYQYGFSLNNDGVSEEWLNYKAKTGREYRSIFYRGETIEFNVIPKKQQDNILIALSKTTLILSLGAKLNVDLFKNIYHFFNEIDIVDFGRPISNLLISSQLPMDFVDDENVRKDIIKYFSSFDSSIVDFKVDQVENDSENKTYKVYAGHKKKNSNDLFYIPLNNESAGTLKMFSLYPYLKEMMNSGGMLVVDELNAKLHPLLMMAIIKSFTNPEINKNNAQLLFTSHDVTEINLNVFRRDEIWFVEKNKDGVTELYSLADFNDGKGNSIRKDENYTKNYLLGKYGAIPSVNQLEL